MLGLVVLGMLAFIMFMVSMMFAADTYRYGFDIVSVLYLLGLILLALAHPLFLIALIAGCIVGIAMEVT